MLAKILSSRSRCFWHSEVASASAEREEERARADDGRKGVGKGIPRRVGESASDRRAQGVAGPPGHVHEPEGEALGEPDALGGVGKEGHRRCPEGAKGDTREDQNGDERPGPVGQREGDQDHHGAAQGDAKRQQPSVAVGDTPYHGREEHLDYPRCDPGEGLADMAVRLGEAVTATDSNGTYGFYNLQPGPYAVRLETERPGETYQPVSDREIGVELRPGAPLLGVDFRVVPRDKPVILQGTVK